MCKRVQGCKCEIQENSQSNKINISLNSWEEESNHRCLSERRSPEVPQTGRQHWNTIRTPPSPATSQVSIERTEIGHTAGGTEQKGLYLQ